MLYGIPGLQDVMLSNTLCTDIQLDEQFVYIDTELWANHI